MLLAEQCLGELECERPLPNPFRTSEKETRGQPSTADSTAELLHDAVMTVNTVPSHTIRVGKTREEKCTARDQRPPRGRSNPGLPQKETVSLFETIAQIHIIYAGSN